jgi:hypothetical protein
LLSALHLVASCNCETRMARSRECPPRITHLRPVPERMLTADDDTGLRVWDASHLLASLLTGAHGCELAPPPVSVLELGAGLGALAAAIASSESVWCAGLRRYVATDLADRLPQLRQTILQHGIGQHVTATECLWGSAQPVPTDAAGAWDVVLLCDLLYWQGGDIFVEDTLTALSATLAAVMAPRTVAILAYRERWPEREAQFAALCEARGLALEAVSPEVFAAAHYSYP